MQAAHQGRRIGQCRHPKQSRRDVSHRAKVAPDYEAALKWFKLSRQAKETKRRLMEADSTSIKAGLCEEIANTEARFCREMSSSSGLTISHFSDFVS